MILYEPLPVPSLGNPGGRQAMGANDDGAGGFTTVTMMLIFAVILFLMRPNRNRPSVKAAPATRNPTNDDDETDHDRPGPSGGHPPPAVN